ncbi:MAG: 3-deoxy-manno-octulosonate cytidylyltransferase [Phycisphaerales bacterium]|nr:3-deoxy-manno-octulosonate cytidylyltransferase [Phycisphaerales bacterium]
MVIIPARLGSTRLPGKVLLAETGKPLIRHVWEAAVGASSIKRVVVATDDLRVLDAVLGFGGEAVMTGAYHQNGTSRLAEAAEKLGLDHEDIVVNVQGDEPELEPGAIDAAVGGLLAGEQTKGGCQVGSLAVPFGDGQDPRDPAMVKVVRSLDGFAMYFSRSVIPHDRDGRVDGGGAGVLRHVGLYVYRRAFLERYVGLPPTPAERCEQLEQLRVLEHGYRIAVAIRERAAIGIDTPEQYSAFVARCRG